MSRQVYRCCPRAEMTEDVVFLSWWFGTQRRPRVAQMDVRLLSGGLEPRRRVLGRGAAENRCDGGRSVWI